jgi:hypothetical protein
LRNFSISDLGKFFIEDSGCASFSSLVQVLTSLAKVLVSALTSALFSGLTFLVS